MQKEMTVMVPINEVYPYERNPRKNEDAVKYVKNSIEKFEKIRQNKNIDKIILQTRRTK